MIGNHELLPANDRKNATTVPHVPVHDLTDWTFGGGTVVWRIWPAVLLHTAFSALIVTISRKTSVDLGIPNILVTLLGVVIGFVISLRVSSGYDRYWWGRCAWSDVTKTTRTMSRLIWINTPARVTKGSSESCPDAISEEVRQIMHEKQIALELLEAFSVALKHHLRGELGIYYEDLYPIVQPFHEYHPQKVPRTETQPPVYAQGRTSIPTRSIEGYTQRRSDVPATPPQKMKSLIDPTIPAINEYGSFSPPTPGRKPSRTSLAPSSPPIFSGERDPLLPSSLPSTRHAISVDLIPFAAVISNLGYYLDILHWFRRQRVDPTDSHEGRDQGSHVDIHQDQLQDHNDDGHTNTTNRRPIRRRRAARRTHNHSGKHRPRVAGDGENIPLEILRCLSEWVSVLDARGTVNSSVLGGMMNCINEFEDSLTILERILTTPLPFIYSVHISTIWIYLFFLPFQLADTFNWYTILGTMLSAFFYLGFVAAGEEIEQPFGYDENDLDLDLICRELIKADLHTLRSPPFPNAPMGSHHIPNEIYETATILEIIQRSHADG